MTGDDRAVPARKHPYASVPDSSLWRKAVAGVPHFDLDPMSKPPFRLEPGDKIATAGSCFAQHISRNLPSYGLNYFVAETAPEGMTKERARELNYGVFSARFGNLYTARQLLQLFDRAFGAPLPELEPWPHPVKGWVDPFRPQIQPEGFPTIDSMLASRDEHLAHVRRMMTELDVLVFTLGLTEAWREKSSGLVVPVAPGVSGGVWDPTRYEFVNFGVGEVTADVLAFIDRLRGVNTRARIILTVSPVPLIATYEPHHVLAATVYSKSVLRVAAEEVRHARSQVAYFPSYEIVVSPFRGTLYFERDLRSVTPEAVAHAMRIFFLHFAGDGAPKARSLVYEQEAAALKTIVCDEEALDS
jgi:hypothetical protein